MEEKTLTKISLIFAIVGIGLIYIANKSFEPEVIPINIVNETMNYVTIRGKLDEMYVSKSGTNFLKVSDDTGIMDVVIFKNTIAYAENLNESMYIEISGKPDIYRGKLEIIASRVQIVNSDLV